MSPGPESSQVLNVPAEILSSLARLAKMNAQFNNHNRGDSVMKTAIGAGI
jgi:hypothetical protein